MVRPLPPRLRTAVKLSLSVFPYAAPWRIGARLYLSPSLRVLCYPGRPSRKQMVVKLCAWNGYAITSDINGPYDVAFHFCNSGPCLLPADKRVLNRNCQDISKAHVAAVFAQVFGYELQVDPLRYEGLMVSKSNANATHDGIVLRGPLPAALLHPKRVYQRLVRAEEGAEAIDLRTPIYAGRVPMVYEKRRPLATRFSSRNTAVCVRRAEEVYSSEELRQLAEFAAAMGLDFGELDVLRDRIDGRIYVVDAANTPGGPPFNTPPDARARALHRLGWAFRELIEGTEAGNLRGAASRPVQAACAEAVSAGYAGG